MKDSGMAKWYDGNSGVICANPGGMIPRDRIKFSGPSNFVQDPYSNVGKKVPLASKAQTPLLKKSGGTAFSQIR